MFLFEFEKLHRMRSQFTIISKWLKPLPLRLLRRREKHLISGKRRKGYASSQYGFDYKTAATGVSLLVMALFSSRAKGSVFDTPSEGEKSVSCQEMGIIALNSGIVSIPAASLYRSQDKRGFL